MKRKTKVTAAVVIFIVIAGGSLTMRRSSSELEVTAETVKSGPLRSIVSATGNIVPERAVDISANIMGEIKKIPVKEGERVEKGNLLIVIDPEYYRAALRREEAGLAAAKAQLALAEANYERADKIYKKKTNVEGEELISQEDYEQLLSEYRVAQSNWEQEKAQVESARANLDKTSIYSPIRGIVTSLNVEEGEVAVTGTMNNPGTVLMTVSDLSKMQAEVEVDETDIINVKIGQEAEITIDAYPDTIFHGTVSEIGNSPIISRIGGGEEEAVDFKVVIDLTDPPANLKPGLTTTADIITDKRDDALFIAIQALTMRSITPNQDLGGAGTTHDDSRGKEKEGVFIVRDGIAIFTPVVTGISDGMNIEIVDGVKEGERVVTGSFETIRTLRDSTRVKTMEYLRARGSARSRGG